MAEIMADSNCKVVPSEDAFIQCMTIEHYVLCTFAFFFGFIYFAFALRLFRAGGLEVGLACGVLYVCLVCVCRLRVVRVYYAEIRLLHHVAYLHLH